MKMTALMTRGKGPIIIKKAPRHGIECLDHKTVFKWSGYSWCSYCPICYSTDKKYRKSVDNFGKKKEIRIKR